ncbi:putative Histidine kinase [Candidatus Promineifilum breve]|uniref:histidine kinase n=2 Tax=Candidatus Promineifilum breve TaxID=1806508 RepID=A0A1A9C8N4_9CHLR|nr:putative Histidine kinase [Candidatus Promineifilum breve]
MWMHHHRRRSTGQPHDGPPDGHGPEWPAEDWHKRRRFFMRRFAGVFVFAVLSAILLLVGLIMLAVRFSGSSIGTAELTLIAACVAVPFLFGILMVGGFAFSRLGSPLADLMAAADAVAAGDLSARVPERGRGNMARLAARFNRMTAELERAEQTRRNLTADVAHELRTPLHILQGNLEGVLDGVYQPSDDHIAAMLDETRLLARLVDELQTLSLAEAGELPLHRRALPAADLLADVAARFAPAAADTGVALEVIDAGAALAVTVDPDRLDQALSNLVGNALRHTPAGGRVTLSAQKAPSGVEIIVSDSGAGIDPADLPFIFDRFWRGDRARTRGSGAGLGLPIARRLVEAHGGRIIANSAPGVGTTMTVWLPATEPA